MTEKDKPNVLITGPDLGSVSASSSVESSLDFYTKILADPPILYHYTSPRSLIEIVQSRKIYATNIRYLNDASEYIYAHDLVASQFRRRIEDETDDDLARYLEFTLGYLDTSDPRYGDIYVASFSAVGDVLSQWRGYCPPEGGYSIGFFPDDLRYAAQQKSGMFPAPWRLAKCEYDGEQQFRLVNNAINSSISAFNYVEADSNNGISKYLSGEEEKAPSRLIDLKSDFFNAIGRLAPVLKHAAFAEEEEWRLVSPTIFDGDPDINFRAGAMSVIPFLYFELPSDAAVKIEDLIVGPSVNQALSLRAAAALCAVPVGKLSKIPYRHLR